MQPSAAPHSEVIRLGRCAQRRIGDARTGSVDVGIIAMKLVHRPRWQPLHRLRPERTVIKVWREPNWKHNAVDIKADPVR